MVAIKYFLELPINLIWFIQNHSFWHVIKAFDQGEVCGSTCNILSKYFHDMMDELASVFYTSYLSQASKAVFVEKNVIWRKFIFNIKH